MTVGDFLDDAHEVVQYGELHLRQQVEISCRLTLFWKSDNGRYSLIARRLFNQSIHDYVFRYTRQPRYYDAVKYADIEGAYFYDRATEVEQVERHSAYLRYDSKVFYNKDTDEYECPLSLPFPTKHPLYWRNQFGIE
ncbi:MAG: hypothetical protein KatS3mg038_2143 [Candidatus Kapaibacterium sp.]|nr:MAG: hypothetical protein KatS3mg038_2143 [Candidatus Kapabacteria bacterium]